MGASDRKSCTRRNTSLRCFLMFLPSKHSTLWQIEKSGPS